MGNLYQRSLFFQTSQPYSVGDFQGLCNKQAVPHFFPEREYIWVMHFLSVKGVTVEPVINNK